jgi:two-component system, OmpR family, KDP operon response regulator KdpE
MRIDLSDISISQAKWRSEQGLMKTRINKIEALDAGADDYLTKPFGVGELIARIRVVMRRLVSVKQNPVYQVGELRIDLARYQVMMDGKEILLMPTEFDLLKVLIRNAGKVITHRRLIHKVWKQSMKMNQEYCA